MIWQNDLKRIINVGTLVAIGKLKIDEEGNIVTTGAAESSSATYEKASFGNDSDLTITFGSNLRELSCSVQTG